MPQIQMNLRFLWFMLIQFHPSSHTKNVFCPLFHLDFKPHSTVHTAKPLLGTCIRSALGMREPVGDPGSLFANPEF